MYEKFRSNYNQSDFKQDPKDVNKGLEKQKKMKELISKY